MGSARWMMSALLAAGMAATTAGCGPVVYDGYEDYDDEYKGQWGLIQDPNGLAALMTCADHDPGVRAEVNTLLQQVSSGSTISSLDAFVAALPLQIRQNVMFWTETRAMQRIYPIEQQQAVSRLPVKTQDRSFHKEGSRWCVSPKDGGEKSCVEARVLLASTEGDFIGTFTTHPESPTAGSFEFALFNPAESTVDYFDLVFNGSSAPTVAKNPDKCMTCHGGRDGTVNWRMDPYRMWAFSTPFNEDNLRPGSVETEWYLSFLERIEGGESVLRHLRPVNDRQTILRELQKGPYQLKAVPASVDFAGRDTPALNITHQLLEKNACRIASSMAQREDFNKIKYAAIGALIDCPNPDEFIPAQGAYQKSNAERYFERMNLGVRGGRFELPALLAETEAKHVALLADRLSRRFDHFTQYAGEDRALAEISESIVQAPVQARYGVTNYETYPSHITKARYLLEPLGVDVANWSMAVDSEFNSHVEFLYPAAFQPVFLDVLKREFDLDSRVGRSIGLSECNDMGTTNGKQSLSQGCRSDVARVSAGLCKDLAAKSRMVLQDFVPKADRWAAAVVDSKESLDADAAVLASRSTLDGLTASAGMVYDTYCQGCHANTYKSGAWFYPFGDMAEMNKLIAREKNASIHALDGQRVGLAGTAKGDWPFDYVSSGDRIWDRVTRHPRQHGVMPRFTQTGLSRADKVTLRAHMLKLWTSQ
jgi:hypothetical protein